MNLESRIKNINSFLSRSDKPFVIHDSRFYFEQSEKRAKRHIPHQTNRRFV